VTNGLIFLAAFVNTVLHINFKLLATKQVDLLPCKALYGYVLTLKTLIYVGTNRMKPLVTEFVM
jgi:hypothetical protein